MNVEPHVLHLRSTVLAIPGHKTHIERDKDVAIHIHLRPSSTDDDTYLALSCSEVPKGMSINGSAATQNV